MWMSSLFFHHGFLQQISLFLILNEPNFRAEFFKEWENYLVDGLDLNPYITLEVKDESGS